MPRGVPNKGKSKVKRGVKLGLDAFIAGSVKYLRKFSADARALVLNQIAKDLRAAGDRVEARAARGPRKAKTVAQEQREVKEAGASTTENTSGGAKRTQKDKGKTSKRKTSGATGAAGDEPADVSGIPGVAEESTSH